MERQSGRRVGRLRYYACQTCLSQAHCTVSVGSFFVNCRLQIGQSLVIMYVITLFSLQTRHLSKNCARRMPEEFVAFRAQLLRDWSVPWEVSG
jgi:hypothetical protein